MFSIIVSIRIKPGYIDKFIEATLDDAKGSVTTEPGCYRFDVLRDESNSNLIHLYEVYLDRAAIEIHRTMPHYLKWRSIVEKWFDGDVERTECTTIFPTDKAWENQKPHLIS